MSDDEPDEKPFAIERAKTGRAKCKKCKSPIEKDEIRIAKLMANPFGDGKMKCWHHVGCIFEVFAKQRHTTKRIENPEDDISGWSNMNDEEQNVIFTKLKEFEDAEPFKGNKKEPKQAKTLAKSSDSTSSPKKKNTDGKKDNEHGKKVEKKMTSNDNMFSEFQRVCNEISSCSSYLEKTAIVKRLFSKGSAKDGFKGDHILWCKLLLPGTEKRIYNLQSKALIKLFARLFAQDDTDMLEDLEQGDVAQTIKKFFQDNLKFKPCKNSDLTLQEVDEFLNNLSKLTKEDEQLQHFKSILKRCTADDLKMIIRLIKHDLRINAGPKHILGAIHDEAYAAFQVSQDLPGIIRRCLGMTSTTPTTTPSSSSTSSKSSPTKSKLATLALMTPVLPMLAEACKSVEMAMQKCPNGMLSEVKYDGERIQIHKRGSEFRYFSRSLKPVLQHKVKFLKEFIPKAFPEGDDLVLDAEILMIDNHTGLPLPFGSLGKHKQAEFKDANVCLFVFDIIYYNGQSLLEKSMKKRRKLLMEKMTPISNRIMLSEVEEIKDSKKLAQMIAKVFKEGLEGLVLKDVNSKYEPGKRHWLKVKKDYLLHGAMADSADLVVLGAWYGTGQKGGIMSVFLMGCYDPGRDKWLTVTKVHTGHDDATLAELQTSLEMVKIGKDPSLLPKWLEANKPMVPDFVAKDPKKQPVWEITGAEFTNQGVHTADGISIRFPRVSRVRDDKDWQSATNMQELRRLFNRSSDSVDYSKLLGVSGDFSDANNRAADDDCQAAGTSENKFANVEMEEESEDVAMEFGDDDVEEGKDNVLKSPGKCKKPAGDVKSEKRVSRSAEKSGRKREGGQYYDGDGDGEKKAKFYSFIGTDYIEYTASGSPLNWVESRKPPKQLPKNAKPIDELDESKLSSRCILGDVRVSIAKNVASEKMKTLCRTLKTLGATILSKNERFQTTHVIHGCSSVPATFITESTNVPKLARHVTESWIDAAVSHCKKPNTMDHAVSLSGAYCACLCSRHK